MGGSSGSDTVVGAGLSLTGIGGRKVVVGLGVAGGGLFSGGNLVLLPVPSSSINLGPLVGKDGNCIRWAKSSALLGSLPLVGRIGGGKRVGFTELLGLLVPSLFFLLSLPGPGMVLKAIRVAPGGFGLLVGGDHWPPKFWLLVGGDHWPPKLICGLCVVIGGCRVLLLASGARVLGRLVGGSLVGEKFNPVISPMGCWVELMKTLADLVELTNGLLVGLKDAGLGEFTKGCSVELTNGGLAELTNGGLVDLLGGGLPEVPAELIKGGLEKLANEALVELTNGLLVVLNDNAGLGELTNGCSVELTNCGLVDLFGDGLEGPVELTNGDLEGPVGVVWKSSA
jgi:hypothetical protein